ncbi:TPA: hypothetical protein DD450_04705, partial [Candidatus Woesebacteria bacterium]|nr:hypothetical protein [Candidatus Woesebacteria bacterium]
MLDSWTTSTELYTLALDAKGFAESRQNIYLETTMAKMRQFQSTIDSMWQNTLSSNGMNNFLSVVTTLAEGFSFLAQKVGLLPLILTTVAVAFSVFKGKMITTTLIHALSTSVVNLGNTLGRMSIIANISGSNMTALKWGVTSLGVAFKGTAFAAGLMNAALTLGLSFGIMKAVSYFSDLSRKTEIQKEEFENLTMSISQLKKETSELPSLISSYEKLYDKLGKTTEEKEELANATARLSSLFGDSVIQLDSEGKAIEVDIEYVKQLTQAKKDLLTVQQQELASKFNSMGKDQYDEILTKQKRIKEINAEIAENDSKVVSLKDYNDPITGYINEKRIKGIQEATAELASERTKLTGESNEIQQDLAKEAYAFDQSTESANKLSQSLINNLSKATFDSGKGFNDLLSVMSVFGKSDVSEVFKRISEDISKGTTTEKATKDIKDMESALNKYGVNANIVTKVIKYFNDAIKLDNAPKATKQMTDVAKAIESVSESTESYLSDSKDLASTVAKMNDGHKMTTEELFKLIKAHPELTSAMTKVNGLYTIEKSAIEKVMEAKNKAFKTKLEQDAKELESSKGLLAKKLSFFKDEVGGIISVAEAKKKNNELYNDNYADSQSVKRANANDLIIQDMKRIEDSLAGIEVSKQITPKDLIASANPDLNKTSKE